MSCSLNLLVLCSILNYLRRSSEISSVEEYDGVCVSACARVCVRERIKGSRFANHFYETMNQFSLFLSKSIFILIVNKKKIK